MTLYAPATASLPMTCLNPGDSGYSWNAETPASLSAGQQFALNPGGIPMVAGGQWISAELAFSGDPGTFEVDIQTADTDTENAYQTEPIAGTITSVTNGYARVELEIKAKYVRGYMKTKPSNAVSTTLKISR